MWVLLNMVRDRGKKSSLRSGLGWKIFTAGSRGARSTEEEGAQRFSPKHCNFLRVSLCSLWLRAKVFLQELQTALAGIFPGFGFEAVAYFWIDFYFVGDVFLL